jgi:hypothetical protein
MPVQYCRIGQIHTTHWICTGCIRWLAWQPIQYCLKGTVGSGRYTPNIHWVYPTHWTIHYEMLSRDIKAYQLIRLLNNTTRTWDAPIEQRIFFGPDLWVNSTVPSAYDSSNPVQVTFPHLWDSVATVMTDVFHKNEINLLRKFSKIVRIFDKVDDSKNRGVI